VFWLVRDTEKSQLAAKTEKAPSQTDTDSKFSHISILDPWSQLTNSNVCTLIKLFYGKIVLGSASLSYTRIALVFCNFKNWSQYFRSTSDDSCTWVKWFANRTKKLEWHPGIGQWRHTRLPMMFRVRRFDINWIKPLMTRSLWLLRTGHRGHRGPQGPCISLFFSFARVIESRVANKRAARQRTNRV